MPKLNTFRYRVTTVYISKMSTYPYICMYVWLLCKRQKIRYVHTDERFLNECDKFDIDNDCDQCYGNLWIVMCMNVCVCLFVCCVALRKLNFRTLFLFNISYFVSNFIKLFRFIVFFFVYFLSIHCFFFVFKYIFYYLFTSLRIYLYAFVIFVCFSFSFSFFSFC